MTAEAMTKVIMKRVDLANSEIDQDIMIEEARSDRAAFARLYRLHYERIFRYCCRRLFNRHAAEDVTSTVFFRVMRTIGSFEGNSNGFRNWLYRIATNAVNDYLRAARRRADTIGIVGQEHGSHHEFVTESDHAVQERNVLVKRALLRLKPKHQTVITLHFFEKMKLTEIAEILGQNPATTRSHLSRALSNLRKHMKASAG